MNLFKKSYIKFNKLNTDEILLKIFLNYIFYYGLSHELCAIYKIDNKRKL